MTRLMAEARNFSAPREKEVAMVLLELLKPKHASGGEEHAVKPTLIAKPKQGKPDYAAMRARLKARFPKITAYLAK
jgi:hypothetical protein